MNKKGFTLIELLVAVTIIAVLSGLALVSYQGARQSARDGKRKSDLEQIRSGLEMCRNDVGSYPVGSDPTSDCSDYLSPMPEDPIDGRSYYYSGSANSYELCTALENPGSDLCGVADSCGSAACNYKVGPP
ncbi:MAG TPA: prepilin-type N-terminal cleavage/methylation domain-containing protein [Patescibacteria group bacterium]|nr:prepilin-type N-terminal cleavage/methylation domain-containing protein [Patescibacteria group bacterium]